MVHVILKKNGVGDMIKELKPNEFYRIRDLVEKQPFVEPRAIINQVNPGRVFVDDLKVPHTALVWLGDNDGFFFIGDEDNPYFNRHIQDYVTIYLSHELKKEGINYFEALAINSDWDQTIQSVFRARPLENWTSILHTINRDRLSPLPTLTRGYDVIKLTSEWYNDSFVKRRLSETWPSFDRFDRYGIGYAVVQDHQVVSLCYSNYTDGHKHSVAVETLHNHKRRNLAKVAAYHYIQDCLEQGFEVHWDCLEHNESSVALAKSLGFERILHYKGYEFNFKN